MKTTAAILVEANRPLEIVDLDVPALKPGQAIVEMSHTGVCHTQLLEVRGHRGDDPYLPHCLGHEGSGVVRDIGADVTRVATGDAVVCSWIKGEGCNTPGSVYQWGGHDVNAGGITTFQRFAVISENRLTKMPDGVSMRDAAMIGCAVPTGVGAVLNTAAAQQGESIAVFGCGGVGLCAIAGAVIAGCSPVIAVDLLPDKLALATQMGATHTVDASTGNVIDAVHAACDGRLDIAIEATGVPAVMAQTLEAVRMQGGRAVVIGNAKHGQTLSFDPKQLNMGKRLLGTWGGDCLPPRDVPRFGRFIADGRLNLAPLIGRTYALEQINTALDDLEAGSVARPMVCLGV